jgi:hypothetical protein
MLNMLLALQLLLSCGLLGFLWMALRRERRMKKLQDALLDEMLPGFTAQQRWFRVNVARQDFFARWTRLFGFEAKGLLIDLGDRVRIVATCHDGERLERQLPKTPEAVRWHGNTGLRAANLHWLELGSAPDVLRVSADTGMNALASREATADLMRALLPQQPLGASARADFALEKHPGALAATVLALVLMVGALVDLTITEHQLLRPRGLFLLGVPAALVGLLLYPLLARRQVPARESWVLSGLVACGLAIAVPGAAMRLDQWLSAGPAATSYRLVEGARLQPVEPGPPEVSLADVREYWKQFEPGTLHELDIVHGPLGLWQLDRSRLNTLTRDWYRREDQSKPADARPAKAASATAD